MKPESPFTSGRSWARPSSMREGVVLGEGQDEDGALPCRRASAPPGRGGGRARGAGGRFADSTIIRPSAPSTTARRRPDESEAGEHGQGQRGDEREARQGAHAAHEDDVLVQEAVEAGVRPEREDDGRRRRGHGDRPVPARGRGEPGEAEGERDEAGEERVAEGGGVEEPLRERAPERRSPAAGVDGERRRVGRDRLDRELLALEGPHAQVRPGRRRQDPRHEHEPGREAGPRSPHVSPPRTATPSPPRSRRR